MNPKIALAIAAVVAAIGGAVWWQRGAGKRVLATCAELELQRATASLAGTHPDTVTRLDIAIAACHESAATLGESIDRGASALKGCEDKRKNAAREFNAYRATAQEDLVQRNNKRSAILYIGREMVDCYSDAVAAAETVATLDAIRASLAVAIRESNDRSLCYFHNQTGCGRIGLNEDHGNDKAGAEGYGTRLPLVAVLADATAKRDALREAARVRASAAGAQTARGTEAIA